MRIKISTILMTALLIVMAALSGCSASNSSQKTSASSSTALYSTDFAMEAPAALGGVYEETEMEPVMDYGAEDSSISRNISDESGSVPITDSAANYGRMVIRNVSLSLETMEFDNGIEEIEKMTLEYSGFMQDSYVQGRSMFDKTATRSASFTLRIPSEKLDMFIDDISGRFNMTNKQQSGSDITDQYYDTDARLKSLRVQEERLLAMLEQAGELEYLLQVEKELANVRYEIESLTSSLLRMQNQVSMSTVDIYLDEVVEYTPIEAIPKTFGEEVSQALKNSVSQFGSFIRGSFIALIWILPFAVFPAAITVIVIVIHKSRKKKVLEMKRSIKNDDEGSKE